MKAIIETEEDLTLVKDWIMLPIVLDVLERDIQKVSATEGIKMSSVYVRMLKSLQYMVTCDIYSRKLKLRERGIKVIEQHRTPLGVEAEYLCRGYTKQISLLWSIVKSDIQNRLCGYVGINISEQP